MCSRQNHLIFIIQFNNFEPSYINFKFCSISYNLNVVWKNEKNIKKLKIIDILILIFFNRISYTTFRT